MGYPNPNPNPNHILGLVHFRVVHFRVVHQASPWTGGQCFAHHPAPLPQYLIYQLENRKPKLKQNHKKHYSLSLVSPIKFNKIFLNSNINIISDDFYLI